MRKIIIILVLLIFSTVSCVADDNAYPDASCNCAEGWTDEQAGSNIIQIVSPGRNGDGEMVEIIGDGFSNFVSSPPTPMSSTGTAYTFNVSLYGFDQDVLKADIYLDYYNDGLFFCRDSIIPWGTIDQNNEWEYEAGTGTFPASGANQVKILINQIGGVTRNLYIDDIYIQDPNTPVTGWEIY